MADLSELHRVLRSAVEQGGGHKIFFYAAGKNGAGLRHGFIAVVDADTCQMNFEHLGNEHALSEIITLKFIKIQDLPMLEQNPATGTNPLQDTAHVLSMLDPAMRSRSTAPAANAEGSGSTRETGAAHAHDATTNISTPRSGLAHLQLKADAIALLQAYYGNSAAQKVAEIEAKFSPLTEPAQFLDGCRQSAALLVGALKAKEVFKELYDTL